MGLFRPSRERRGPDRWLDLKLLLFSLGAAVGLTGMLLGRDWVIFTAIGILALGVLVRFLPGEQDPAGEEDPAGED